jgi:hypothetical protein
MPALDEVLRSRRRRVEYVVVANEGVLRASYRTCAASRPASTRLEPVLDLRGFDHSGSVQQIIEYLVQLLGALGITYFTIPSDQMDEFAAVVEYLAGR